MKVRPIHKVLSLLLAGAFMLNLISGTLELAAQAATDDYTIKLSKSETNVEDKTAYILRGQNLQLYAKMLNREITEVAVSKADEPLNVMDTSLTVNRNELFSMISQGGVNKASLKPLTKPELVTQGKDPAIAAYGTYGVVTNYQTYAKTAARVKGRDAARGREGTMVCQSDLLIGTESGFTLEIKYDTSLGNFVFYMKDGTGVFQDWVDANQEITAREYVSGNETRAETFTLIMTAPTLGTKTFKFSPNYSWTETVGDSGAAHEETRYNLQRDSSKTYTYDITYFYAMTDPAFNLFVLNPKEELNKHVTNAATTNLVANPEPSVYSSASQNNFVKLTNGQDRNDYITSDLYLASQMDIYGNSVRFQWEWIPDNPEYKDNIVISANPMEMDGYHFYRAAIHRDMNDVKGKLKVTGKYNDSLIQQDVYYETSNADVTALLDLTLHGLGTLPTVRQYSQIVGQDPEQVFDVNHQNLVSPKTMDTYRNTSVYYKETEDPYVYKLQINTGAGNGMAKQVVIDCADDAPKEDVSVSVTQGGTTAEYNFGDTIEVSSGENSIITVIFTATKEVGETSSRLPLKFRFYVEGPGGSTREEPAAQQDLMLIIKNTSPDDDTSLEKLFVKDQVRENIDFGFTSDVLEYTIDVPYVTDKIFVSPQFSKTSKANRSTRVDWSSVGQPTIGASVPGGGTSPPIDLIANEMVTVRITITAQDGTTKGSYILNVLREPPNDDATLKDLQVLDREDTNHLSDFDPKVREYQVEVPFRADKVQILAEPNDPYVQEIVYDPPLEKDSLFGKKNWLTLNEPGGLPTTLTITVTPQNGLEYDQKVYKLTITRLAPGENAYLSDLTVSDTEGNAQTYTPAFHKEMEGSDYYELEIPYSMKKLKFTATPEDPNATIELMHDKKVLQELGPGAPSKAFEIDYMENPSDYYEMTVRVTAENEANQISYPIRILRSSPSDDASLSGLTVTQEGGQTAELDPVFMTDTYNYTVTIPYETQKVTLTATLGFAEAGLTIYGKKTASGTASSPIEIKYPGTTTIKVVITAQNGRTTRTYSVKVRREKPSTDARLKSLAITGIEDAYKPVFVPDTLRYTATVAVGQEGVVITAIPNHAHATLKIDGKTVKNGDASELIRMMKIKQKVEIVVTAQDGKTTKTYTIQFTDKNKIELTDNANLRSLVVKPGVMTPKFTPSATTYDVAVKEDVNAVQIIPKPDDDLAKVQVFYGSLEIGDWDGNYAQTIVDGENSFKVTVTSPSGKVTKDYIILVHRNEEDQMQTLNPVTADEINFDQTGEVVMVDITKYTRVAADVFNTLKEEYPEKTIVFEGNDYSLEFKGEDLDTIVPHTDVFDFALSFTSPEETDILNITDRYPQNDDARMVFIYFDHHGALPAPATFTVSLGHKYQSETLYWNYYNPERDRIDYLGNVKTNTKGTFAVKIDHLSTYIVSDQRLFGSENKAANSTTTDSLAAAAGENLSAEATSKKINPGTGVQNDGKEEAKKGRGEGADAN